MKNETTMGITTILLADARPLEDEAVFSRLLGTVNAERQCDVQRKRFKEDQVLSLAGGLLLDELRRRWEIPEPVTHDPAGKPVIRGRPEVFLSLTHTYPYAAAMICWKPCGLDIERQNRKLEPVAARYYLESEKAWAGSDLARLTDIWCRKECMIKCLGFRDVRHIDTFRIPEGWQFLDRSLEGYSFQILLPEGPWALETLDFPTSEIYNKSNA